MRRTVTAVAALVLVSIGLLRLSTDTDVELPPVVDTSAYRPTVEPVDTAPPFPGNKDYDRPPRYELPIESEQQLFAAWYAYFSGKPGALNKLAGTPGEVKSGPELTLEDMLPAIEACAYGELKEC